MSFWWQLRRGVRGHALSAGSGCAHRHQDFGGPALLCAHLRADFLCPAAAGALRARSWDGGAATSRRAVRALAPAMGLAGVAAVAVLAIASPRSLTGMLAFAIAGWLIGASILDIRKRKGARASAFAAALAHAGLGVTLMGVAGTSLWRSEALDVVGPGQTMTVGPYTLRFDGVKKVQGPNFEASQAQIALMENGRVETVLRPEKRLYPAEGQEVADTAIRTTGLRDLYLALGDDRGHGRWTVRAYVSPLAPFIWLGALVMALGGLLSLWGRLRIRVGGAVAGRAARRMTRVLILLLLFTGSLMVSRAFAGVWAGLRRAGARQLRRSGHGGPRPRPAAAIAVSGLSGREHRRIQRHLGRRSAPSGAPANGGRQKRRPDQAISGRPLWRLHFDEAPASARHLLFMAGAFCGTFGGGRSGLLGHPPGQISRRRAAGRTLIFFHLTVRNSQECGRIPILRFSGVMYPPDLSRSA